jgi:hypothetical protein
MLRYKYAFVKDNKKNLNCETQETNWARFQYIN